MTGVSIETVGGQLELLVLALALRRGMAGVDVKTAGDGAVGDGRGWLHFKTVRAHG